MQKWIGIGNLVKDPEFQTTTSGLSVCKFTVAVQRRFKNENGESEADFINIVTWRKLADNCNKYLRKGNKVCVTGVIQTRTYDAQDGTKRYITEIIADDIEFLTASKENENKPKTESQNRQEVMQHFEPIDDDNSKLPF